jgi:hypothetical protein
MASFATALTEFSDKENARTYMVDGHTVQQPRLVIQKRKVPATPVAVSQSSVDVIYGTLDPDGNVLQSKVGFSVSIRYPANGQASDVAAALAVFRDLVASDEFTATVTSQGYLQ